MTVVYKYCIQSKTRDVNVNTDISYTQLGHCGERQEKSPTAKSYSTIIH